MRTAGRPELPQALVETRKDLEMALRLETIYSQPRREDFWTGQDQDDGYGQAFREFGIDVTVLSAAEAAERIRASKIARELARGLDFWAFMRKWAAPKESPTWQQLLQIAEAADPDPERNEVRLALRNEDRAGLERLAETADVGRLPPDTLVLLGRSLSGYGNDAAAPKVAEALLRRAQIEYPTDLWINDTLGVMCMRSGKFDDATRFYQVTVTLRPSNLHMMAQVGQALAEKGARQEAIAMFSKVIELAPASSQIWRRRGDMYLYLGEQEKAIADYNRAIELDPKSSEAWNNRGSSYRRMGQYQKAIADFSKAIELGSGSSVSWANRGLAYSIVGESAKALADYSKAIELDPKYAAAHRNLAWLLASCPLEKLRDPRRAVELAKKALELAPKEGSYWNTLGVAQYRCRDFQAALTALQKSIELRQGGDYSDWFFVAMAQWQLGSKKEARAWYDKAVAWQEKNLPKNDELRRFREEAAKLLEVREKK